MSKLVKGAARLYLGAGEAKPSAKVGQALGPLGINMADVCRNFNDVSKLYKPGVPLRAFVTAYEDRTYDLGVKGPTTSYYLKLAAGIEKGSKEPGKVIVGSVDVRQIYHIAQMKLKDPGMEYIGIEAMCRSVASSCRSMGLEVTK